MQSNSFILSCLKKVLIYVLVAILVLRGILWYTAEHAILNMNKLTAEADLLKDEAAQLGDVDSVTDPVRGR